MIYKLSTGHGAVVFVVVGRLKLPTTSTVGADGAQKHWGARALTRECSAEI